MKSILQYVLISLLLTPLSTYAQQSLPPETLIKNALQNTQLNQPNGVPELDSQKTLSGQTAIATGGTTARTFAAITADRINVKSFGAVGNTQRIANGPTTTAGSTLLLISVADFTAGDVGKTLIVAGAGASGGVLTTTIQAYINPNAITMATPALTTVSPTTAVGTYKVMWGTDDTAAFQAAVSAANNAMAGGIYPCLYIPGGNYLLSSPPGSFAEYRPGCVQGDGPAHSNLWLSPSFSGNVFDWSEAWIPFTSGAQVKDLRIDGWQGAAAGTQNGLIFYDRNDNVTMENVDLWSLSGRAFYAGVEKNVTEAFIRESHHLDHIRVFNSGAPNYPAVELTSQFTGTSPTDTTNSIMMADLRIYGSNGPSLVIRNAGSHGMGSIIIDHASIEGTENGTTAADLVVIGDPVMTGVLDQITLSNVSLGDPYTGYAALRLTAPSLSSAPYEINVQGIIEGGIPNGKGLQIDSGHDSHFAFTQIHTTNTNITVGPSTMVGPRIYITGYGEEAGWTYNIDPTSASNVLIPSMHSGGVSITNPRPQVLLSGTVTSAAAVRLTADGNSAATGNVLNLVASTHYHTRVSASCRDTTAAGWASWDGLPGDLDRGTGSTVTYVGGYTASTAPSRSSGTLTGMSLILAADATNMGLSVIATPASGNTDTIHCVSNVEATEVTQ